MRYGNFYACDYDTSVVRVRVMKRTLDTYEILGGYLDGPRTPIGWSGKAQSQSVEQNRDVWKKKVPELRVHHTGVTFINRRQCLDNQD